MVTNKHNITEIMQTQEVLASDINKNENKLASKVDIETFDEEMAMINE